MWIIAIELESLGGCYAPNATVGLGSSMIGPVSVKKLPDTLSLIPRCCWCTGPNPTTLVLCPKCEEQAKDLRRKAGLEIR
jgi:hypothetical protein